MDKDSSATTAIKNYGYCSANKEFTDIGVHHDKVMIYHSIFVMWY